MQTAPPDTAPRPMPTWLSIPIILLCLAGGGYIIHWYVMSDPLSHEAKILGDPPTQANWNNGGNQRQRNNNNWNQPANNGGNRPNNPNRNPITNNPNQVRYVRPNGDNRWEIGTELAYADVSVSNGKPNWHSIAYNNHSFIADDVYNTIIAARKIAHDDTRIAALKLTPEQVKKLRALTPLIPMSVSDADRAEFGVQVVAYAQGDETARQAMESKLEQELDQVAQRSIAGTRQLAQNRAAAINAIISPEQWKQNTALGAAAGK